MSLCKLDANLKRNDACGYSLPEIVTIYLANFEDVAGSITPTADTAGCESIATIPSGITWYQIDPAKNSASFTDELVVEDNGTKYRTHTLTFNTLGNYTACQHLAFDQLSLGKYVAIIKTAEGSYLMLGRLTGLEASTAVLNGGSENNGMNIVLAANTTESVVPTVAPTTIAA